VADDEPVRKAAKAPAKATKKVAKKATKATPKAAVTPPPPPAAAPPPPPPPPGSAPQTWAPPSTAWTPPPQGTPWTAGPQYGTPPPPGAAASGDTSKLAIASLAMSITGATVIPILGAVVGATLAPFAFRDIYSTDPPKRGKGYAMGGLVVGLIVGLLPSVLITYLQLSEWGTPPFLLALLWTAVVLALALRAAKPGDRGPIGGLLAGGAAMTVISILAILGLGYLFALVTGEIIEAIGDSIDSAFADAFDFDCTP
jgi:hypothetical protein